MILHHKMSERKHTGDDKPKAIPNYHDILPGRERGEGKCLFGHYQQNKKKT